MKFAFPLTTMSAVIFWDLPIIGYITHWCEKQGMFWNYTRLSNCGYTIANAATVLFTNKYFRTLCKSLSAFSPFLTIGLSAFLWNPVGFRRQPTLISTSGIVIIFMLTHDIYCYPFIFIVWITCRTLSKYKVVQIHIAFVLKTSSPKLHWIGSSSCHILERTVQDGHTYHFPIFTPFNQGIS